MALSKMPIPLAIFAFLVISFNVEVSVAQDAPWHFVIAHNVARGEVGVPPVSWDPKLAAYAQNHVNKLKQKCTLAQSGGPYGENLYSSWEKGDKSGVDAVNDWVSEKKFYDPKTNKCQAGKRCNRYLQVVWRNTHRIGCAKAKCRNSALIVCSYDPRGNIPGQRPFDVDQFEQGPNDIVSYSADDDLSYSLDSENTSYSPDMENFNYQLDEVSQAQNITEDSLRDHNKARAQVGVGPLTWDSKLAAYAQNHVNKLRQKCKLAQSGGPYGENLYSSWGQGDKSVVDAVNEWVSEKKFYNPKTNKCASGKRCNRYLQVVWRRSVRLGCAKATCGKSALIVCNYDPRGSIPGQRPFDVDPFEVPISYQSS